MRFAPSHRIVVFSLVPALLFGGTSLALGGGRATDSPSLSATGDNDKALKEAIRSGRQVTVIVQLADAPLATYAGGIRGIGVTKPAKGKKLDKRSAAALGYSRFLSERRASFRAYLRSNAASAVVEAEYDTTLNGLAIMLSGGDLQAVLAGPGVRSVSIDREFRPAMNLSRGLIGGIAFNAAFPGITGEGMKVGIIDSGILASHPFFDPSGYSTLPGFPIADNLSNLGACTTAKVIVARAYPKPPGTDACADNNGHGTHVAGTVAGNIGTAATIGIVTIPGLSGVAHRARLGNYNVFPNDQASARSVEIIQAIEDAVGDGMDVLNMSLGGPVLQPEQGDPLAQAVNAAAEAGVVVSVAAGNAGPGFYTVSSPGNASGALTAAASTNPHFLGIPVTWTGLSEPLAAVLGQFGDFIPSITAPLANYNNTAADVGAGASTQACSPATASHTGQIVVIDRGVCTFSTKIRNAQLAGAIAVLMVNNSPGDPVAMGQDGTPDQPTIDAAMVRQVNRSALRTAAAAGTTATIDGTLAAYSGTTPNADIIAGFSSVGPVAFDNRFKPDVTAPGVNVLSSTVDPDTPGFDWAFFQGTSMATPHVAGAATLLKQLHPDWSPEQIKSALITRAKRPVFGGSGLSQGGGRINLNTAKDVNLTFSPANFSFGWLQPKNKAQSVTRTVTFTNISGASLDWTATIPAGCAVTAGAVATFAFFGPAGGTLSATGSASFTVVATTVPNGPQAFCLGDVTVTTSGAGGAQTHRVPWLLSHLENVNSAPP